MEQTDGCDETHPEPPCGGGSTRRCRRTDTCVRVTNFGKMRTKLPGGCGEQVRGGRDGDPTPLMSLGFLNHINVLTNSNQINLGAKKQKKQKNAALIQTKTWQAQATLP